MPREIKKLTQAINRALARVKESMASRTLFASAIAHEIRTPVSIVQLELEQINHPRAEKALADLLKLTQTLDTLTSLARLDAVIDPELKNCDLADIAREVTASMAPIVFASGKTIAFEDLGKTEVFTAPVLVENLIRNLIENAVKHATSGSTIKVVAGPGPVLEISDEIQAAASRKSGQESKVDMKQNTTKATSGIGQRIVERICELLGADFLVSRNSLGGHTATIRFESNKG
jgi:signal transduction histidine kinase